MSILFSVIAAYFPYAAVTAFTPGPNNILALHAISQFGWRKGLSSVLGILTGFFCVMLICAGSCWGLAQQLPAITIWLKYIGAAYIFWLAWHIASSKPAAEQNSEESGGGFWQAFGLQFLNVKIIMYGITIFTAYVLPSSSASPFVLANCIFLTLIVAAGFLTWGWAGSVFASFINQHFRPFNLAMAAVLALCGLGLLV